MTWHELNRHLKTLKSEAEVRALIEQEMAQVYPRRRWVLRMFSRLHRLRNQREAAELRRRLKV